LLLFGFDPLNMSSFPSFGARERPAVVAPDEAVDINDVS
jgi:hypothetical protein